MSGFFLIFITLVLSLYFPSNEIVFESITDYSQ